MFSLRVSVVALLAIGLITRFDQGAALTCYTCTSEKNEDCLENTKNLEPVACVIPPITTAAPPTTSTVAPGSTSTAAPGTTATAAPGTTLTAAPGTTATAAPGTTLTAAPGTTATATPGTTLTAAPGTTLTAAPGTTATATPSGTTLTAAPGTTATATPGTTLTAAPGTTLTAAPGTTLTAAPGSTATAAPTNPPTDQSPPPGEQGMDAYGQEQPETVQIFSRFRRNALLPRVDDTPVCYKVVSTVDGKEIVGRGCARQGECARSIEGLKDTKCYECTKDSCNGSSRINLGIMSILLSVGLVAIFFR